MAYMLSYSPSTPPANLTQGPLLPDWCMHELVLGTTPSETMCGVCLCEASGGRKSSDDVLYHVMCHFSRRVRNAIG